MGQNGLAAARWTHQQQVVSTSCGDGESLSSELLPGKVQKFVGRFRRCRGCWNRCLFGLIAGLKRPWSMTPQTLHERSQRWGTVNHEASDQRSLGCVINRYGQGAGLLFGRFAGNGQDSAARPDAAVQSQLSGTPKAVENWCIKLTARHQQSQCNGKVEGGAFLAQVCRRQIHHHPHEWSTKSAVAQRCPDPFP
tara:strand:- start:37 stop:618 length:582 start_codon:yes stop_codon:yes gene_type:complete